MAWRGLKRSHAGLAMTAATPSRIGSKSPRRAAAPRGHPKGRCSIGGTRRVIVANSNGIAGTYGLTSTPVRPAAATTAVSRHILQATLLQVSGSGEKRKRTTAVQYARVLPLPSEPRHLSIPGGAARWRARGGVVPGTRYASALVAPHWPGSSGSTDTRVLSRSSGFSSDVPRSRPVWPPPGHGIRKGQDAAVSLHVWPRPR